MGAEESTRGEGKTVLISAGLLLLLVALLLLAFSLIGLIAWTSVRMEVAPRGAIYSTSILGSLLAFGALTGAAIILHRDYRVPNHCKKWLRRYEDHVGASSDWFIGLTFLLNFTYIYFYFYSATLLGRRTAVAGTMPIDPAVTAISGVMLGALVLFAVCYGSYVKHTKRLETALTEARIESDEDRQHHRELVVHLRRTVFRGEHLFEPPGNVFVTIGIAATFLGLSMGLVVLDLPSLLSPASGEVGGAAMTKLTSFVGCMELALGLSMLGVLIAMAAQVARGYGASEATEDLIDRADRWLNSLPAAAGDPERAARGVNVAKSDHA